MSGKLCCKPALFISFLPRLRPAFTSARAVFSLRELNKSSVRGWGGRNAGAGRGGTQRRLGWMGLMALRDRQTENKIIPAPLSAWPFRRDSVNEITSICYGRDDDDSEYGGRRRRRPRPPRRRPDYAAVEGYRCQKHAGPKHGGRGGAGGTPHRAPSITFCYSPISDLLWAGALSIVRLDRTRPDRTVFSNWVARARNGTEQAVQSHHFPPQVTLSLIGPHPHPPPPTSPRLHHSG